METSHVQQDRYDNDNNDMHERLLDPCGPSPDPPDWRDSLLKEKKERKSLCFLVLKNPPLVRNGVVWSHHLLFIFIFKMAKIK